MKNWGVSRQIYVAATDAQALAEAKDAEMWYQDSLPRFVSPRAHRGRAPEPAARVPRRWRSASSRSPGRAWSRETVAFGSPDTVARHIQTMRDMGIGQVLCWMNFGGLPQDKIRRSMELFAREVMPHGGGR